MCLDLVGQVVEVPASEEGIALINADGVIRRASLVLLAVDGIEVAEGDWLLVHTGLATQILSPSEAAELLVHRSEMLAALSEGDR